MALRPQPTSEVDVHAIRAYDWIGRHVCHLAAVDDEPQEGWNELPPPSLAPRRHRELLRAVVAVRTGISYYKVNLHELDAAYSIAFPHSTPLNISKKRRQNM